MLRLPTFLRLADLLLVAAKVLRAFSSTNVARGFVSEESRLATRIEAIAAEVASLHGSKQ